LTELVLEKYSPITNNNVQIVLAVGDKSHAVSQLCTTREIIEWKITDINLAMYI
jgi:hypothetical protein